MSTHILSLANSIHVRLCALETGAHPPTPRLAVGPYPNPQAVDHVRQATNHWFSNTIPETDTQSAVSELIQRCVSTTFRYSHDQNTSDIEEQSVAGLTFHIYLTNNLANNLLHIEIHPSVTAHDYALTSQSFQMIAELLEACTRNDQRITDMYPLEITLHGDLYIPALAPQDCLRPSAQTIAVTFPDPQSHAAALCANLRRYIPDKKYYREVAYPDLDRLAHPQPVHTWKDTGFNFHLFTPADADAIYAKLESVINLPNLKQLKHVENHDYPELHTNVRFPASSQCSNYAVVVTFTKFRGRAAELMLDVINNRSMDDVRVPQYPPSFQDALTDFLFIVFTLLQHNSQYIPIPELKLGAGFHVWLQAAYPIMRASKKYDEYIVESHDNRFEDALQDQRTVPIEPNLVRALINTHFFVKRMNNTRPNASETYQATESPIIRQHAPFITKLIQDILYNSLSTDVPTANIPGVNMSISYNKITPRSLGHKRVLNVWIAPRDKDNFPVSENEYILLHYFLSQFRSAVTDTAYLRGTDIVFVFQSLYVHEHLFQFKRQDTNTSLNVYDDTNTALLGFHDLAPFLKNLQKHINQYAGAPAEFDAFEVMKQAWAKITSYRFTPDYNNIRVDVPNVNMVLEVKYRAEKRIINVVVRRHDESLVLHKQPEWVALYYLFGLFSAYAEIDKEHTMRLVLQDAYRSQEMFTDVGRTYRRALTKRTSYKTGFIDLLDLDHFKEWIFYHVFGGDIYV